ncbi:MAG: hypothetical protein LBD24_01000 [Spirochaetaceae bacterium]|nr:hypothetical protein [Spirochaetaceae bacterium]
MCCAEARDAYEAVGGCAAYLPPAFGEAGLPKPHGSARRHAPLSCLRLLCGALREAYETAGGCGGG